MVVEIALLQNELSFLKVAVAEWYLNLHAITWARNFSKLYQILATQDCSHHIQAMVSFDPARMAWPEPMMRLRHCRAKVFTQKSHQKAPLGCQSIHSTSWKIIGAIFCQEKKCLPPFVWWQPAGSINQLRRFCPTLEGPSKLWTSDPSPLFHILQHWSCKEMNLTVQNNQYPLMEGAKVF